MSEESQKSEENPVPETIQEGKDAFISYSRNDSEFVRWLAEEFEKAGRRPWIDWGAIQPAEEWWQAHLGWD